MQKSIQSFVEKIFSINSTISTVYGSALTVGSKDMAAVGISNSASDIVFKLRVAATSLAGLLSKSERDKPAIEAKRMDIEGYLMALQTIGQISDQFCNNLVGELQDIVKR